MQRLSKLQGVTHDVKHESQEEVSQCVEAIDFSYGVVLNLKQHVVAVDGHVGEVAADGTREVEDGRFPGLSGVVGDVVLEIRVVVEGVNKHIHAIPGGRHGGLQSQAQEEVVQVVVVRGS